jgi:hypothetical protein
MKVGSFYNETAAVTNQASFTGQLVKFPTYSAWPRGTQAVSCSTELAGDIRPANDRKTGTTRIRVQDVAATGILAPGDTALLGDTVMPVGRVVNHGTDTASFSTTMTIGAWTKTTNVIVAPGVQDLVDFPAWIAQPVGRFARTCSTYLAGDVVPGNNVFHDSVSVVTAGINDDEGTTALPRCFALHGARPNPVREQAQISYDLASSAFNHIAVYDAQGRLVRELVARSQMPGRYQVSWDCRDAAGRGVAPGVYFCRMLAGSFQATAKMLLMP